MLKLAFIAVTGLGLAVAGVLLHPKPRDTFAFATADGRGLMVYACMANDTPEAGESNALAAHRFLQAELLVNAEPQVQIMVAEMDSLNTSQAKPGLVATLAEAELLRQEILRNLSATYGCRVVRSQISQG